MFLLLYKWLDDPHTWKTVCSKCSVFLFIHYQPIPFRLHLETTESQERERARKHQWDSFGCKAVNKNAPKRSDSLGTNLAPSIHFVFLFLFLFLFLFCFFLFLFSSLDWAFKPKDWSYCEVLYLDKYFCFFLFFTF